MNKQILNTEILRTDERLGAIEWPDLEKIDVLPVNAGDCILICAGFEDRAFDVLNRVSKTDKTGFAIGVISYLPAYPENRTEKFLEVARKTGSIVTEFPYNREEPVGIGDKLHEFIQYFGRVFIDISGMSRLLIVQTLTALVPSGHPITVLYSEAKEYPPSRKEFSQRQDDDLANSLISYLSSGIFEISAVPELSSVSMQGAAIRLVAFPSLDPIQLQNLLRDLQPTYTDIVHGVPPAQENKWRTEAVRGLNRSMLDTLRKSNKREHEVSTLIYQETLKLLLAIYAERSMFDRIVIAPTGSKMQTVAVGLFRAALYDIQIVYPTPHKFTDPNEYTKGVRQLYKLDLPNNIVENDEIDNSDPDVERQPPE